MTPTQLWQEFLAINSQAGSEPEPWAFGAEADRLADLVARGIKTSTSSAHALYAVEGEDVPTTGDRFMRPFSLSGWQKQACPSQKIC